MTYKDPTGPKARYQQSKQKAKERGIKMLLTFEEWYQIWLDSGHYHERGRNKGQYVMSRIGDQGNYEVGNVFIQKTEDNLSQGQANRHVTPEEIEHMHAGMQAQPKFTCSVCGAGPMWRNGITRWHSHQEKS